MQCIIDTEGMSQVAGKFGGIRPFGAYNCIKKTEISNEIMEAVRGSGNQVRLPFRLFASKESTSGTCRIRHVDSIELLKKKKDKVSENAILKKIKREQCLEMKEMDGVAAKKDGDSEFL